MMGRVYSLIGFAGAPFITVIEGHRAQRFFLSRRSVGVCLQMAVVHVRLYRSGSWTTFGGRSVSDRGNRFGQVYRQSTVRLKPSAALPPSY